LLIDTKMKARADCRLIVVRLGVGHELSWGISGKSFNIADHAEDGCPDGSSQQFDPRRFF
jgi:hypothetical protein